MGISLFKTIISSTIGSFIGNILAKVFMWAVIIMVAHGGLLYLVGKVNGNETTFGASLGQAVKGDINFVMDNSEAIFKGAISTVEDFNSELRK
jgi:uncharacterized membrane protein